MGLLPLLQPFVWLLYLGLLFAAVLLAQRSRDSRAGAMAWYFLGCWALSQYAWLHQILHIFDPLITCSTIVVTYYLLHRTRAERAAGMVSPMWMWIIILGEGVLALSYPLKPYYNQGFYLVEIVFVIEILTIIIVAIRRLRARAT